MILIILLLAFSLQGMDNTCSALQRKKNLRKSCKLKLILNPETISSYSLTIKKGSLLQDLADLPTDFSEIISNDTRPDVTPKAINIVELIARDSKITELDGKKLKDMFPNVTKVDLSRKRGDNTTSGLREITNSNYLRGGGYVAVMGHKNLTPEYLRNVQEEMRSSWWEKLKNPRNMFGEALIVGLLTGYAFYDLLKSSGSIASRLNTLISNRRLYCLTTGLSITVFGILSNNLAKQRDTKIYFDEPENKK